MQDNTVSFGDQVSEEDKEAFASLLAAMEVSPRETLDQEYDREYAEAPEEIRQKMDRVGRETTKAAIQAARDYKHILQHFDELSDEDVQNYLVWKRTYEVGNRNPEIDEWGFGISEDILRLFDHTREIFELPAGG